MTFVTLHPKGINVDLMKDEGQIPYTLCKNYNINATIVTSHIDKNGANVKCVPGLNIIHFPLLFNNVSITGAIYLLLNARRIDWLNIYFAGRQAYYWAKLFKRLNPNGKIYLKLDMDFRSCDLYDKNLSERKIFYKNTEIIDLISVESKAIKARIQNYSAKEIIVIGNGFFKIDRKLDLYQKRDNLFLTVGRLGTRQKATEILLEAFAKSAEHHDWNLKLIGLINEDFKPIINKFFEKNPKLKSRIIFTGELKSREELYKEYCMAKVFVLPSRWESFGISCGEALSCGCRLLLTDQIPPGNEMTDHGHFGTIIPAGDVNALSDAMVQMSQQECSVTQIEEMHEYANMHFSWDRICEKLYEYLSKRT